MASSSLLSDAALQAHDKRLLTRDWVDRNSRKCEDQRPKPSGNPRKTLIGSNQLDGSDIEDVDDVKGQGFIEDVEEDGDESGFAEHLFKTCLHIFQELYLELSTLSPLPRCIRDGLLVKGLGQFYLWGEGFRDGTLDTVLEQSDELCEAVLRLICRIGRILSRRLFPMVVAPLRRIKLDNAIQRLILLSERANAIVSGSTSEADSDSDDADEEHDAPDGRHVGEGTIGRDIRLLTECLMDLLPTLEQSLPRVGKPTRSALLAPPPVFRVSEPAFTYVRIVYDKYPQADIKLTERLGEANWQRHIKIRARIDQVANDEMVESKAFVVAPFSEFRDSALGSSIPTQSHYAVSAASHTSFVSSLADGEERSIRVPPTPAEVSAGKAFQCHICGLTLHKIRNRVDWKIHVFADLRPYICTFSTCNDALVQFPTRKMWVDHEFDNHRVDRSWVCPDCLVEFLSPDVWDEHLRQEHCIIFSGPQHSIALGSAQRIKSKPIDEQECPMCKIIPGTTRRAFSTHVGRHMEQIALAVLPRETEDDLDGSSVTTDVPIYDLRNGSSPDSDFALTQIASLGRFSQVEGSRCGGSEAYQEHVLDTNEVMRDSRDERPISSVPAPRSEYKLLNELSTGSSRTWTNRSGSFLVEAELIGLGDDHLRLRKASGTIIAVPTVMLAIEDLEYVEQVISVSLDREKVRLSDPARSLAGDANTRWKCSQCPKSFRRRPNMRQHEMTHSYQFRCERCGDRFARKYTFMKHTLDGNCTPFEVKDSLESPDLPLDEEYIIKCFCANKEDDGNTVLCEECDTWQHIKCYYTEPKIPDVHVCTACVPRTIKTKKQVEQIPLSVQDTVSYVKIIDSILAVSDLKVISEKRIRTGIQETVGHDVSHHKTAIKALISERFDKIVEEKTSTPKAQSVKSPQTSYIDELRDRRKIDVEEDTKIEWKKSRLDPLTSDTAYPYEHVSASGADDNLRLDRTMSEVYQDSLYTPGLGSSTTTTQARPASNQSGLLSRSRNVVLERLEAAKNGHLSVRSQSPSDHHSAERSAFVARSKLGFAPQTAAQASRGLLLGEFGCVNPQHQHDDERVSPKVIVPGDELLDFDPSDRTEYLGPPPTPLPAQLPTTFDEENESAPYLPDSPLSEPPPTPPPAQLPTTFDEENESAHFLLGSPSSEPPEFVLYKE